MNLLIDTNILLDVLQNREPHVHYSSLIWKLCESKRIIGYVSTLTFANLVYVLRKELDPEKIENIYRKMSLIFEFVDFENKDLLNAASMKWNDFEDAIQYALANKINANYIITRNVKDFSKSEITALTPAELLSIV